MESYQIYMFTDKEDTGLKIAQFFGRLLFPPTKTIAISGPIALETAVAVEEMAIFACVNLLAGIVAKCEFKTYLGNQPQKEDEYYLWNYEPNRNQNSVQLLQELIAKLLIHNEVLLVTAGGSLFLADSYNHEEYAMRDDVFTDVCCNNFTFNRPFYSPDVIFLRLNDADVKQCMRGLYLLYGKALGEAFDKYQKSGGKLGVLDIAGVAAGHPDFEKNLGTLMNDRFKRFFQEKNAVLPLMDGYKYTPLASESSKKTTNEVSDIRSLTEQAMERAANAFKISPQLLRGDVTNIDDAINATLTFAIDPIVRQLEVEINRKRYGREAIKAGNYLRIDCTCVKHVDVFDVADKADKLIAARLYNTNELRRKIGDEPIDADWANEYMQTKNYDSIPTDTSGKGGKTE